VETLESAMQQDYSNLEIIISDNASVDNTAEVVSPYLEDPRVSYFAQTKNIGMVNNWRDALYKHVTGEWFVVLSDDDYFIDKSYISKAVELILKDNSLVLIYANGYIKHEGSGKTVELDIPLGEINDGVDVFMIRNNVKPQDFTLCNVLFNTDMSKTLNCFSNEYNVSCDSELFLKLCLRGKVGFVNDPVSVYRVHNSNLISSVVQNYELFVNNWLHITEPYLDAVSREVLTEKDMRLFKRNVLFPFVHMILMDAATFFPNKYNAIEKKLSDDIGGRPVLEAAKSQLTSFKRILLHDKLRWLIPLKKIRIFLYGKLRWLIALKKN